MKKRFALPSYQFEWYTSYYDDAMILGWRQLVVYLHFEPNTFAVTWGWEGTKELPSKKVAYFTFINNGRQL